MNAGSARGGTIGHKKGRERAQKKRKSKAEVEREGEVAGAVAKAQRQWRERSGRSGGALADERLSACASLATNLDGVFSRGTHVLASRHVAVLYWNRSGYWPRWHPLRGQPGNAVNFDY